MSSGGIAFVYASILVVPGISYAQTFEQLYNATVLFLYGGIGFFGALSILYFFGGFIVYLVRLGQEFRQVGLYYLLHGVRILFYVLCAILVLRLLE